MEVKHTLLLCLLAGCVSTIVNAATTYCYEEEELLDRYNRLPTNLDNLIAIVKKIERNETAINWSLQAMLATILDEFKADGLTYNDETGIDVIKEEDDRSSLLSELAPNVRTQGGLGGMLTTAESCSLHWMISHSYNDTKRTDENRRYKREEREELIGPRYETSLTPLEIGVAYTQYGTVAFGSVLQGINAALAGVPKAISELVEEGSHQHLLDVSIDINQIIVPLWAATLAGEAAQHIVFGNSKEELFIREGEWNNTVCPREYALPDETIISYMTAAEILGGIDGYLIGTKIKEWDHENIRLSQVLEMYYSEAGISYDTNFRACNRKQHLNDIFNKAELKTQIEAMGAALACEDQKWCGAAKNITLKSQQMINKIMEYANNADYPCADTSTSSATTVHTNASADVFILLDTDTNKAILADIQYNLLGSLVNKLDIGYGLGRIAFTTTIGSDFTERLPLGNLTNKAEVTCNITSTDIGVASGSFNVELALTNLRDALREEYIYEHENHITDSNSKVLLLVVSDGRVGDKVEAAKQFANFVDTYPEVTIMTVTGDKDWEDFATSTNDAFRYSTSDENLADDIANRISSIPMNYVYHMCNESNEMLHNEEDHELVDYISPHQIRFYSISQKFFHSSSKFILEIEIIDGEATVCTSRLTSHPNEDDSQSYCEKVSSRGTMNADFGEGCNNDNCRPIYFSIQGEPSTGSSTTCDDPECRFPNQIKYRVQHRGMYCVKGSAAAISLSSLLLAVIFCLYW